MASIVENFIGDRAVQLGNEEWVRKMPWGNAWNYLRVGLWCRIFGTQSTTPLTLLQIGINNGDQNTFNSNNCAGYVGTNLSHPSTASFGYEAVNKRYASGSTYVNGFVTKTGATATYSLVAGTTGVCYVAGANSPTPSIIMADFIRASASSYTPYMYFTTAAQFNILQPARFYDYLRTLDDGTYAGNFVTTGNGSTLGSLPSNMDTISIFWNRNIPMLEIEYLTVMAFS